MRQSVLRNASLALVLFAVGIASGTAHAQSSEGTVRLGADATILDVVYFPDGDVLGATFGVVGGFGPSIGYFFTDEIAIGARLNFGAIYVDAVDDWFGFVTVLPYFEYNFVSDQVIQGFIGAEVGYSYQDGDIDGAFLVGGMGGIHIFATSDFSISPTGHVGFQYDFDFDTAGLYFDVTLQFLGYMDLTPNVAVTVQ